jgi:tetratricopeptide (TPR) repeat protein/predicted Ser/Thr protein kinase
MSPADDTTPPAEPTTRDAILDRFEDAWQRGERPTIHDYLPADPAARRAVLPDLVHIDLERRLKAGETVRVEHYLQPERFPELAQQRTELISLILAEYNLRQGRSHVTPEEYLRRFPQYHAELQAQLPTASSPTTHPARHPEPGPGATFAEAFGRYRIVQVLGGGGMGTVYLAYDTHLERHVALKVPRLTEAGCRAVERFAREARAAAHLHHPNICPVYDAGEINGIPFLTMAYIEGQPLTQALPPPLPPGQAAGLVRQLALALEEAHRHGVIHRDLKPGNVLVNRRGEPVITDFGLARRTLPEDAGFTLPGQVLGTPAYMPPEQAEGAVAAIGPGADIYSLGVILYELLTGQRPFQGSTPTVLHQVAHQEPPPPRQWRPDLDARLEAICLRAMAKRIEHRFASMADFAAALAEWLNGPARPPPAATASPPPDPRVAEDALRLLRDWGWTMGLEKLKANLQAADETRRAALQVLLGWLAGERGHYTEALEQFRDTESWPRLAGWALAGRAFVARRERDHAAARALLAQAAARAEPEDTALRATIAHGRAIDAYDQGRTEEALAQLHAALEELGPGHFATGRVLDTLGMVHATRANLPLARAFYAQSLAAKRHCGDDAGIALTHGQLGRLYLDWGQLDRADEYLRTGIALARRIGDERGEAQLTNHRGQVLLARGRPAEALTQLDESIRMARGRWPVVEGYARKDRAGACLALGKPDEAERESDQAETLFQAVPFAEGVAHVQRVRGLIRRAQGRYDEAVQCLQAAAAPFEQRDERAEAARTVWELARTLRARGAAPALVAQTLLAALDHAERSRHSHLVAAIERELQEVAESEQVRRAYRRARGAGAPEDTAELLGGAGEMATVLVVQVRSDAAVEEDPTDLLPLRNHLYADLEAVLEDSQVAVSRYGGDGFVAVVRGADHACRAVSAALAVARHVGECNRPRRVLGWPLWHAHAGIASGAVCVGNVGTYRKLDFTAVGTPVRLAVAMAAEALPGLPCLSEATHQLTGPRFAYQPGSPRTLSLKGLGPQRVWDVSAQQ